MAGFASLIGGVGQAAQEHGQQVRNILEQRRNHFVDLLLQQASLTGDQQQRGELLSLAGKGASGVDMSKWAPDAFKTLQNHVESTNALSQLVGGPPSTPKPQPGPGSGIPGGSAAQPPSSPVSPSQQGQGVMITPNNPGQNPGVQSPEIPNPQPQQTQPIQATPTQAGAPPQLGMSMGDEIRMMQSLTPAMRPIMQPEITQAAQLRREIEMREEGIGRLKSLLNDPTFEPGQPEMMRATLASSLIGKSMPMMGISSINTPIEAGTRSNADILRESPDAKDFQGHALDPNGISKIQQNKLDHTKIDYVQNTPTSGTGFDSNGQQIATSKYLAPGTPTGVQAPSGVGFDQSGQGVAFNRFNPPGTPTGTVAPLSFGTDTQGNQIRVSKYGDQGSKTGATNPSFIPTVHEGIRPINTTDDKGNEVTLLQPVTTSSHRSTGSGPKPITTNGSSPTSFPRPLTPEEHLKTEQQFNQYNTAVDRAQRVLQSSHLLDSMLESGKLQFQLSQQNGQSYLGAVVNRGMQMTPAEADLLKNFISLQESVNLIRGPLGATGFRGPEAFAALQAQKGTLLGNPDVTRGTISNFIQELKNQLGPISQRLQKNPSAQTPQSTPSSGSAVDDLVKKYGGH